MAEKFDQETLDILMKDNEINEEKFKEFHKKIFEEMVDQSLFLACNIFLKKENDLVLVTLIKNCQI